MTHLQKKILARWRRLDHHQRFSVMALISVSVCALLFGWLLRSTVHRIVKENDENQTAAFVRHVIATEFAGELFRSGDPIHDTELGNRLLSALALDEVFRIKIYGGDGRIIWSDETELLGIRFADNVYLARALKGETCSVIESPERTEHVFERGLFDQIMETYIPIQEQGAVVGVIEIYRHPAGLARATRLASLLLWAASIGGGALLYLAMVGVVRRINTTQRGLEKDLRRAADALAVEKSKLERIVNATEAGLILVDPAGRVLWSNERAETWFGGEDGLVGASFFDRLCSVGDRCRQCPFDPSTPPPKFPLTCEHIRNGNGDRCVYQLITTLEPPVEGERQSANYLQLILDVTEAKQVEAQLRQADKMSLTGQLAAGIAHQINNPVGILMTTITYRLALLRDAVDGGLKQDLEMMERQCSRIDQSVRSLLSFARLPENVRVPVDLRSVLTEAIELTKPRMKQADVGLETSFEDHPYVTMADPNDVLQVMLNLINNAIDAMPSGGELTLAIGSAPLARGRALLLSVRDTGEGLRPGDAERVFEPFYTTKSVANGTGLGLAVSRRIVDGLGGKIEAANGRDCGAEFKVCFPEADAYRGS